MGSGAAVRLRCPDCSKAVGALEGSPICPGCGRLFSPSEGIWNLLPRVLDPVKAHEDQVHAEEGLPTWRRLFFHKRYWVEWCDTRWLPSLVDDRTRTFLEIGGGLCYASALAKAHAPHAYVVATDVSPRYLRHHAVKVGQIFETSADAYAAADAERLPFEDEQFDAIYSQVVLYRLPDPVGALREVWRVLAPGGRYRGSSAPRRGQDRSTRARPGRCAGAPRRARSTSGRSSTVSGRQCSGRLGLDRSTSLRCQAAGCAFPGFVGSATWCVQST